MLYFMANKVAWSRDKRNKNKQDIIEVIKDYERALDAPNSNYFSFHSYSCLKLTNFNVCFTAFVAFALLISALLLL